MPSPASMKQCDAETSENAKKPGRGLLDVLLVALCVSLLLALAVMLRPQRSAQPPIPEAAPEVTPDPHPLLIIADVVVQPEDVEGDGRERLMSLGFVLLLVSLAVCLYATYRLGFCCNRREYNRGRLRRSIPSVSSRLHLISGTDLPPPYGAVVDLQPPPYFTIIAFQEEKLPPTYTSVAAQTAAGASSRPQEAG